MTNEAKLEPVENKGRLEVLTGTPEPAPVAPASPEEEAFSRCIKALMTLANMGEQCLSQEGWDSPLMQTKARKAFMEGSHAAFKLVAQFAAKALQPMVELDDKRRKAVKP